jgi:hypothetical protein
MDSEFLKQLGAHCRHGDQLPGSRRKGVTVCGVPRVWVAAGLGLLGALLLQRSHALLTFASSLLLGKHSGVWVLPDNRSVQYLSIYVSWVARIAAW